MATQVESIKWIPGTKLMVDGFNFTSPACKHYFLTHMHSDHTTGLSRHFDAGVVYCSPLTARLLARDYGLRRDVIRPLEVGVRHMVQGVTVTLLPANHCPGAVMLLFEVPKQGGGSNSSSSGHPSAKAPPTTCPTTNVLHTGDMRWQPWMADHPGLKGVRVDVLYLDTTYCLPRYTFPPQDEAIALIVRLCKEHEQREPRTLFVIGAYHIGKERAFLGAAAQLGWTLYADAAKRKVLDLLDLGKGERDLLTDDPASARMHCCFMGQMKPEQLRERALRAGGRPAVVGFRPTGWSFRPKGGLDKRVHRLGGNICTNGGSSGGDGDGDGVARAGGGSGPARGGGATAQDAGGDAMEVEEEEAGSVAATNTNTAAAAAAAGDTADFEPAVDACGPGVAAGGGPVVEVTLYGVPYSEHSSFEELRDCVARLRPVKIVPTVNAPTPSRARLIVDRFADLMDLSGDKSRMDAYLMPPKTLNPTCCHLPAAAAAATQVDGPGATAVTRASAGGLAGMQQLRQVLQQQQQRGAKRTKLLLGPHWQVQEGGRGGSGRRCAAAGSQEGREVEEEGDGPACMGTGSYAGWGGSSSGGGAYIARGCGGVGLTTGTSLYEGEEKERRSPYQEGEEEEGDTMDGGADDPGPAHDPSSHYELEVQLGDQPLSFQGQQQHKQRKEAERPGPRDSASGGGPGGATTGSAAVAAAIAARAAPSCQRHPAGIRQQEQVGEGNGGEAFDLSQVDVEQQRAILDALRSGGQGGGGGGAKRMPQKQASLRAWFSPKA